MRNQQLQQPSDSGLELLAQLGMLEDPIKQLGGLVSIMMQIEEADQMATRTGLAQQEFAQQQAYQNANLDLNRQGLAFDMKKNDENDRLQRASMMTQMLSSQVPGMNPAVYGDVFGQAGMPGLFGAFKQMGPQMSPTTSLLIPKIEGWRATKQ